MEKEVYTKPKIQTEEIEIGVYGNGYGDSETGCCMGSMC